MPYQVVSGRPTVTPTPVANRGADDILAAGQTLLAATDRAAERKDKRVQAQAERDLRVQLQAEQERAADERLAQELGFSREGLAAQLLPQGFVPVDAGEAASMRSFAEAAPGVSDALSGVPGASAIAERLGTTAQNAGRTDMRVGDQGYRFDPEASSAAVLQRGQQTFARGMQDDAQEFTQGENVQDRTLQRYGIDTGAATSRYSADSSAAASRYGADRSLEGTKYSADTSLAAANVRSANNGLQNLQADDVAVSPSQRLRLYENLQALGVDNPDSVVTAVVDRAEAGARSSIAPYLGITPGPGGTAPPTPGPGGVAAPRVPPADRARQLRSQNPGWNAQQIAEQMRKEGYNAR